MQNETAVKLLVYYMTRLAFTVLCLAIGTPRCKSDTFDRLNKLTLLRPGVFVFTLKQCDCYICQVLVKTLAFCPGGCVLTPFDPHRAEP
jgi:hypothetical protein